MTRYNSPTHRPDGHGIRFDPTIPANPTFPHHSGRKVLSDRRSRRGGWLHCGMGILPAREGVSGFGGGRIDEARDSTLCAASVVVTASVFVIDDQERLLMIRRTDSGLLALGTCQDG